MEALMLRTQEKTIVLGEHELELREFLETALKCLGYSVKSAEDGDEVINYLMSRKSRVSAVVLDITKPQRDGMETLREIHRIDARLPVIVISGVSSTLEVVTAMRNGATDFLVKPVAHHDLKRALTRAVENRSPHDHVPTPPEPVLPTGSLRGSAHKKLQELQSRIALIARSDAPVLIQGETGCGKEVLAREVHAQSPRAGKIFLKLNCAALPSELVESELFGYERGAFTGAFQRRIGIFEMANEGTLLLDEIGDMDVRLQAKLLQVLQDHEFQRIGGKQVIKVDVRVMSATHRDLHRAIAEGTFREDLYYRLNVINVQLPPLRERIEDILPLAEFLLNKHTPSGTHLAAITPEVRQALLAYHWPGNVRELENTVIKLIALNDADLLAAELRSRAPRHLFPIPGETLRSEGSKTSDRESAKAPENVQSFEAPKTSDCETTKASVWEQVKKAKRQAEADAIVAALDKTRWNRRQAAGLLQIEYKSLLYKMKILGIEDTGRIDYTVSRPEIPCARSAGCVKERAAVKKAERARKETTKALHQGGEDRHFEATLSATADGLQVL
jgi:two-component system response regulator AtoC